MARPDRPTLTIDPARQFGQPCITGTRVPAESVATQVAAGDSVEVVADDYEITRDQVLFACWWFVGEQRHFQSDYARAVVAAWWDWADTWVIQIYGGWNDGEVPDPPAVELEAKRQA